MTGRGRSRATSREQARAWSAADPDLETRRVLDALLANDDDRAIEGLFDGHLEFGTAGLRAPMGPGPRQMNRLVVRQATAGVIDELAGRAGAVVIGHDARKNSAVFAEDAARVVASTGATAMTWDHPVPTPLVAFAVRHLTANAGVVCTASHNPASDNGYKVYAADGAQLVPPTDRRVAAHIGASLDVPLAPRTHAAIERIDDSLTEAYIEHLCRALPSRAPTDRVKVVYSPLHGVGGAITLAAFARAGHAPPHVVEAQCRPDGAFPTVAAPNPEDPAAVAMARNLAGAVDADVALVHDPDADRLGVLAPFHGRWRSLTGNEIGLLLADHVLRNSTGGDRLVVDTIVSSSALAKLTATYGVHHRRTQTGFKWIVRPAIDHPELRQVFAYEEALGFSVDPYVRDKDGIGAALMAVDLFASLRAAGETIADRLADLAERVGLFATASWTLAATDDDQPAEAMARLRAEPPSAFGTERVLEVIDFTRGPGTAQIDLMEFRFEHGARLSIRPSGTEPKLKVYAEVTAPVTDRASYDAAVVVADQHLARVRATASPLLESLVRS